MNKNNIPELFAIWLEELGYTPVYQDLIPEYRRHFILGRERIKIQSGDNIIIFYNVLLPEQHWRIGFCYASTEDDMIIDFADPECFNKILTRFSL